ncbi:MAG: hypothetical protein IPJ16_08750 [Bacteroidales bacterium]|nr:hypothetical protein [Bacteroidales bacterium]
MNSLKNRIVFIFVIGLIITFNSCEHDSLTNSACGVENPFTNLPWLNEYVKNMSSNTTHDYTRINYYLHGSENIIEIQWNLIGIQDAPTGVLYNCSGIQLYSCRGNQPIDTCLNVLKDSKFIGTLWEKE